MLNKDITINKNELRKFGITMSIVLAALAGFSWWREHSYYIYLAAVSSVMLFLGLAFPSNLSLIYKTWMKFSLILGSLMTKLILYLLFYLVLTPIRIISKLCGKEFLDQKIEKSKESFWIQKKNNKFNKADYEKHF